jgi:poly(hydroxyalkanoate) granule-associated protein
MPPPRRPPRIRSSAIARAQKEGPAAFQDAVVEGLKLLGQSQTQRRVRDAFETAQETLQSRVGGAREQAQETWDNLEALFQSRVQRAMHQLGVPTAEEVRALTRRVTELNETVSKINSRPRAAKKKAARRAQRKAAAAPSRARTRRSKSTG